MIKRQFLSLCALFMAAVSLISWGVTGHRTIGKIASDHLSPQAAAAVRELLGNESLAGIASWADEVRNQPEYRHTAAWHYIDLPLGLSFPEFKRTVEGMSKENVYRAILEQEKILESTASSKEQKTEALKFLVHFIGDLHQPMHVSREEDKGGNTIQLNYSGVGTNLHALWDSKLLDHEGLDYMQLAQQCGHAGPGQIKAWQGDPLIEWIWESYQISSKLYAEVDALHGRSIGDSYYETHIGIIRERLEQAGIRLAGVLNRVFASGLAASSGTASGHPLSIDIRDAAKHYDEYVRTCAKVEGYKALESMTLVNLGAAYPYQFLTIVLRGAAIDAYKGWDGQTVCVTGKLTRYKDKPEIIVTDPAMVKVGESH